METLESLQRKISSAAELKSVVKTMKAMAASSISQYEMAVSSLSLYFSNVEQALLAYLCNYDLHTLPEVNRKKKPDISIIIVFGSDQGLVGRFNEVIAEPIMLQLSSTPSSTPTEVWTVGERLNDLFAESSWKAVRNFQVPGGVQSITGLIAELLHAIHDKEEETELADVQLWHNRPKSGAGYEQVHQHILPLNLEWMDQWKNKTWSSRQIPQVIGEDSHLLERIIREYIFVSLYRACAESLASENESRLEAMQRADRDIDNILTELNSTFHRLRQNTIDEELFDLIAGFEALKKSR
ncbi:MAG: F0F1 ATP synthase subunit gamma [Bacteroidetes bacterium]|nr:F0F1 ATP synthase subunit gamma [Bacteroidota bacterium]